MGPAGLRARTGTQGRAELVRAEGDGGGNEIRTAALELVHQYVQFCSEGEGEFFATEDSLLLAANEYESTESEIFKKE